MQRKGKNVLVVSPLLRLQIYLSLMLLVLHLLLVELLILQITLIFGRALIKSGRGGNVIWNCNFSKNEFHNAYYRVKGHFLGLPCWLGECKVVFVTQQREMEREDAIGMGKVATTSRKQKNKDPLPFLRKSSRSRRYGNELKIHNKQGIGQLQVV